MQHERHVTVTNKYGLHARTSTRLAQVANQFQSEVQLRRDGSEETIDAKSILGIMTLGAERGQILRVLAEGQDAENALDAIVRLFESNFDEE